ncbi:E3 ubiquitin-protein ligase MBR2 [Sesamum alatum]|uniref:RING-type E3 ubiquitin transferase n=1 Tax=Sesamum alatum TaxID=300844 RepID=A0AAE2CWP7_9LAMI|nr:E3 ubiquitin-protein ligase MBR2 [Sesamum alatum]
MSNLDQEIRADAVISSPDDITNSLFILRQAHVSHDDIINSLHELDDQRAEGTRSGIHRIDEILMTLDPRRWNLHATPSDATISKYLETRSRRAARRVSDGEGIVCVVCLDELHCHGDEGEGTMIATLGCGHEYHVPCIKQWLLRNNVCPLCRTLTVPPS